MKTEERNDEIRSDLCVLIFICQIRRKLVREVSQGWEIMFVAEYESEVVGQCSVGLVRRFSIVAG